MNELLSHYNTTYLQAGTISTLVILVGIWAYWPKKQRSKDITKEVQQSQQSLETLKYMRNKLHNLREANR